MANKFNSKRADGSERIKKHDTTRNKTGIEELQEAQRKREPAMVGRRIDSRTYVLVKPENNTDAHEERWKAKVQQQRENNYN